MKKLVSKNPSASLHAKSFHRYAQEFEEVGMKTSANQLRLWIDRMVSSEPPSMSAYEVAYSEFCAELMDVFAISQNVLAEIELLLTYPSNVSQKMVEQAVSFLGELGTQTKLVNKILMTFRHGNLDQEQLFYGDCFVYLMQMEGVFDTLLYFLCGWSEATAGSSVKNADLETAKQTLQILRNRRGVHFLQEEYWDDEGHLRNSIAHARFSYSTNVGHFRDSYHGRATYDQTISAPTMNKKVVSLCNLSLAVLSLLVFRILIRSALLDLAQQGIASSS